MSCTKMELRKEISLRGYKGKVNMLSFNLLPVKVEKQPLGPNSQWW